MKKKGIGGRSQVEMEVWGWRHKERRATKALWLKKVKIILHMLIRKRKRQRVIKVDLCPSPPKEANAREYRDACRMLSGPTS